jgi:hypothetical protein
MNIKEFRQRYPEYNDIDDVSLARKLHAKDYSDMPFDTFAQRFGVSAGADPASQPNSGMRYPPTPDQISQLRSERAATRDAGQVAASQEFGRFVNTPREPSPPNWMEDVAQNWPQYLGGTVGGTLGTLLGGPAGFVGSLYAGSLGAGLGGASGKGWQETLSGRVDEGTYDRMRSAFANEAVGELIGQPIGTAIGKVASGGLARGRVLPGIERLNERLRTAATGLEDTGELPPLLLRKAQEGNSFVPVNQATKSRGLQRLDNFVRGSYIGGGGLYDLNQINPVVYRKVIRDEIDDFWDEAGGKLGSDQVGRVFSRAVSGNKSELTKMFADKLTRGLNAVPDSQMGDAVSEALKNNRSAWRAAGSAKYSAIDNAIRNSGSEPVVNMADVMKAGQEILDASKVGGGLGSAPGLQRLGNRILKINPSMSFSDADALRSFVLEEGRKLKVPLGNKSEKIARAISDIETAIDNAMGKAVEGKPIDIMQMLGDARNFWRMNSQMEKSPFVQGLAKRANDKPQQLAEYIFAAGAPDQIKMAKAVLGDDAFSNLRDTWLSSAVAESMKDPRSIGGSLKSKLDKMGKDSLLVMFGSDQTTELYRTADVFNRIGAKTFENTAIASLADKAINDPGRFISSVFEPRNPSMVKTVRRVVGDDQFKVLRAAWVEDSLRRAGGDPKKRFQTILKDMGDDTLNAMFTPKHVASLKEIGQLGSVLNLSTVDASNILAPLLEAGAVAGVLTWRDKALKSAVGVLGIPAFMGKVLSNERYAYWLAQGVKDPDKMKLYTKRIAAEIVRYGPGGPESKANMAEPVTDANLDPSKVMPRQPVFGGKI